MATYRTIATTETDPEAPVTAQLMKALEANPTAIAEGEADAPRVTGVALGGIYRFGGALTTTPRLFSNLDRLVHVKIDLTVSDNTAVLMDFSSNNGATFGATTSVLSAVGSASAVAGLTINVTTGAAWVSGVGISSAGTASVIANIVACTVPANVNAFRVYLNGGGGTGSAAVYVIGGKP